MSGLSTMRGGGGGDGIMSLKFVFSLAYLLRYIYNVCLHAVRMQVLKPRSSDFNSVLHTYKCTNHGFIDEIVIEKDISHDENI